MAEAAAPEEAPQKGSKGQKIVLLITLVLLSLGGLAGGLVSSVGVDGISDLFTPRDTVEEVEGEAVVDPVAEEQAKFEKLEFLPMQEMIVNIAAFTATGKRTSRFLKLNVALVYDVNDEESGQVLERLPMIREAFMEYSRLLTERDLQGSVGFATLKEELLRRAKTISGTKAVHEVLISDLIIQ